MKRITLALVALLIFTVPALAGAPTTVKPFGFTMAEENLAGYTCFHSDATFRLDTAAADLYVNTFEARNDSDPYFPTSAGAFYMVCADATDDFTVDCRYLDANWDLQTVTLTALGQTEVPSVVTAIRFIDATINDGGTNEGNGGVVYFYWATGATSGAPDSHATTDCLMLAGEGKTSKAHIAIPRNYIGVLKSVHFGTDDDASSLYKVWSYTADDSRYLMEHSVYIPKYQYFFGNGDFAMQFPEKTDVWLTVQVATGTLDLSAGFKLYTRPE